MQYLIHRSIQQQLQTSLCWARYIYTYTYIHIYTCLQEYPVAAPNAFTLRSTRPHNQATRTAALTSDTHGVLSHVDWHVLLPHVDVAGDMMAQLENVS